MPLAPNAGVNLELARQRLERAIALLSCLAFAADEGAELDLGPVAIAARGLVDEALLGLASVSKTLEATSGRARLVS